jgi:hypothetical protein
MDRDGRGGDAMTDVLKIAIAVIVGILLLGILFKLLKIAIIIALAVGVVMVAQNYFGPKRLK